ncbi:hypothetical protein J3Q64DRAFT_1859886 [Phycomyces blakesleeanus]|uniref:Arrestin C-terminal-like domain-containing protein n=1 Tax=Phycomyces blakesleeanus TaxID=4837 RepID=A0ABR3BJ38_PHYBL
MVRVDDTNGDGKGEWINHAITTYFETEWKLWGNDGSAFSQCGWDEMDAGRYTYPFALKFPNCNYPPSIEEPAGFHIRFIWSTQIDGPGLESSLKSKDYVTPYRPVLISTPDKEWIFKSTLVKDRRTPLAEVQAKLDRQSYCPDEACGLQLTIAILHADTKCVGIQYKFRKHHEGKMLVQQGTAFRDHVRVVLQGTVPFKDTHISEHVAFKIPTRLVSPSFLTRHTRVRYDILFQVTTAHGHLFKTNHVSEFAIPITIANLPYDQLLRVPRATMVEHYQNSVASPFFFEPSLEEPPEDTDGDIEAMAAITDDLTRTPGEEPPSYFSLEQQPSQFRNKRERKERTVYLSRSAKGVHFGVDMVDAKVVSGIYDEDW